jgi:hypothetical protein
MAQVGRRRAEHLPHGPVELAPAAEPSGESDVGDGEVGVVEEPPGEVRAPGPRQLIRGHSQVGDEQPAKMPRRHADPGRERRLGAAVVHDAADDLLDRLADELGCAGGDRSGDPVGAAAVARPEARGFGRGRMVEGPDVL